MIPIFFVIIVLNDLPWLRIHWLTWSVVSVHAVNVTIETGSCWAFFSVRLFKTQ